MIILGILLLIGAPFLFIGSAVLKKKRLLKISAAVYSVVLTFILVSETMNCFVLYHTTEFSEKYHNAAGSSGFTVSELTALCEEIIIGANELAEEVSRDDNGVMIVPEDLTRLANEAMNIIGEDYPELKGPYPQPKKIMCSMLMTQLDLQGIYFPFSLEANYNSKLSPARVPCTAIHELSHLRGFIREDESCFIAYRACIASDSPELRYSGMLSAMNYLLNAVKKNADYDEFLRLCYLISDKVRKDNIFVSEEFRKKVEQKAVIPTETVSAISETAMDTTLKLNGVTDGKKSYGRMVNLLLEYHCYIEKEE